MFFKLIFYLLVLKSAFGFRIRYEYPRGIHEYEYNLQLSGWTKLHTEPAEWLTARTNCHMEGAFLASPWNTEFTHTIYFLVRKNQLLGQLYTDKIWSGVHSSFDEGALKSVEGNQIISLQHDDLAPLERCGVFRQFDTDEVDCSIALPYICYRPGPSAPPSMPEEPISTPEQNSYSPEFISTEQTPYPSDVLSKILKKLSPSSTEGSLPEPAPSTDAVLVVDSSKCGDESLGYQFAELTGHCYKFHAQAVYTWDRAKSACEDEDAYLAIANSDEEVKVLKKIYAKKIYGATFPDTAAIGFYKYGNSWITLEGESIESAGYAKWRPEAPHFTARLGFIARDGLLYGYTRDVRNVPYICEKPALKQEVNQGTESTETESAVAEDEAIESKWNTEAIDSKWNTESATLTEETDEALDSKWNTESATLTEETDEALDSKWNTESATLTEETDEAIDSKWNTESATRTEETDEALDSKWNTESATLTEETDEAIDSKWNTESATRTEETDEALDSKWNTESATLTEETDEALDSKWNTESVPVAEETDEAIDSKWSTESYPVTEETDEEIQPKLITEPLYMRLSREHYTWDYPSNWNYGNTGYRRRQYRF